ncbi:MAG: FixH family protein [Spirochaetia bacterium]|jgi:hypothetical protein|nr:FixH family protein [Spirochaetia bacterium]
MKRLALILTASAMLTSLALFADNTPLKEGKNTAINAQYSFTYEFPEKPKLGTYVLRVNVFKGKEKVKDLIVLASYDMPSMRGHHGSGKPAPMQLNKQNDYLMPVNFVMRGKWEVVLSFQQNGKELYNGIFLVEI